MTLTGSLATPNSILGRSQILGFVHSVSALAVVSVMAVAENVIQVTFNEPIHYTGLLDPQDASVASLYVVTPVAGTVGYDGQPARAVSVLTATQGGQPGEIDPNVILLTLDRPMTPYPAQYVVSSTGLIWAANLTDLIEAITLGTTPALFRVLNPPDPSAAAPGRDLANPQTLQASIDSTIAQPLVAPLGSFGYDGTGDYAIDQKDDGLRKRLMRRLFTKKGGFLHLGDAYGVGITTYGKQLARASTRAQLAADCESQFAREPEVAQVRVLTRLDPQNAAMVRLDVYIKKKSGQTAKYTALFPIQ